ncbi:unnamed protein product [Ambrosiozyma monospora]|uniref:Unnamed protein product n=1 Tax=Ambrosiozyma monospora TaxID=43982 RepID=A0A9W6T3L7_AMBMO|nr:unnamed protein product [Ambrosiozyma monospora]
MKIRIYEQTHLLNGNVVYNERIPQIILAPTADKQFNGLSERTVQTLSRTHNAITIHISQSARDKYFDHSYKHAAALYNITPHQATGKPPSEIYLGATKLPKTMPMFLQDGLIKVYDQPYIIKAYFLGYDTYGRFLVMRMDTHQETYCTTFRPLNSFEFHTMDVSLPGRPFRAQFNSMKVINSARLANSIKKKRRTDLHDPLYISPSFEDAMQNDEFRQAIKKEMTQFTELKVFEQYTASTRRGYKPLNEQEKAVIAKQTKNQQRYKRRNRKRNLHKQVPNISSITNTRAHEPQLADSTKEKLSST